MRSCGMMAIRMALLLAGLLPLSATEAWWTPTLRGHLLSQAEVGISTAIGPAGGQPSQVGILSAAWGLQAYRGYLGYGLLQTRGDSRLQLDAASLSIGLALLRTRHDPWIGEARRWYVGIEVRASPALLADGPLWTRGWHVDAALLHDNQATDTYGVIGLGWGF